jgi:hypothetical protein
MSTSPLQELLITDLQTGAGREAIKGAKVTVH